MSKYEQPNKLHEVIIFFANISAIILLLIYNQFRLLWGGGKYPVQVLKKVPTNLYFWEAQTMSPTL